MRAGLLRDKIIVQKLSVTKDSFGANSTVWIDKFSTRAQVTYNSGNRLNQNNEIINTYNVTFTIRIYNDVNEADRVICNSKKYRILFISRELYKQTITIIGELINE